MSDYLTDTNLERIRYKKRDVPGKGIHWDEELTHFGTQTDLMDCILDGDYQKRIVILGESGLGKTILLKRLRKSIAAEVLAEGPGKPSCLPVYIELRTLFIGDRDNDESKEDSLKAFIAETSKNFHPDFFGRYKLVLLLDGLNENIANADRILRALQNAFPDATWVITGQPQIMQVRELDVNREMGSGWSFFRVSKVASDTLKEKLIPKRLRKHLGVEEDTEVPTGKLNTANEYFRTAPSSISQSPRYVDLVASLIAKEDEVLPETEFGILDRCMHHSIRESLMKERDISGRPEWEGMEEEVIELRKNILGCIAFHNVFAEVPLSTERKEYKAWLKKCRKAGLLASDFENPDAWYKHAERLVENMGPWNSDGYCVFDHDTTQSWASARSLEAIFRECDETSNALILTALLYCAICNKSLAESLIMGVTHENIALLKTAAEMKIHKNYLLFLSLKVIIYKAMKGREPEATGVNIDAQRILDDLNQLYDEGDWLTRVEIIELLFPTDSKEEGILDLLIKAVNDEKVCIRTAAVGPLKEFASNDRGFEALVKCLDDDASWIRHHALEALSRFVGSKETLQDKMVEIVEKNLNADYSSLFVMKLAPVAQDKRIQKLLFSIASERNGVLKASAIRAIASLASTQEVKSLLVDSVNDPDQYVRMEVVKAFASIAYQEDVLCLLLNVLSDPEEDVAIMSLWKLAAVATEDRNVRDNFLEYFERQDYFREREVFAKLICFLEENSGLISDRVLEHLLRGPFDVSLMALPDDELDKLVSAIELWSMVNTSFISIDLCLTTLNDDYLLYLVSDEGNGLMRELLKDHKIGLISELEFHKEALACRTRPGDKDVENLFAGADEILHRDKSGLVRSSIPERISHSLKQLGRYTVNYKDLFEVIGKVESLEDLFLRLSRDAKNVGCSNDRIQQRRFVDDTKTRMVDPDLISGKWHIFETVLTTDVMPEDSFALHMNGQPCFINPGTIKLGLLRQAKRELNIEWTAEDHKALYEIFEKEVYDELKKKFQEEEPEDSDD